MIKNVENPTALADKNVIDTKMGLGEVVTLTLIFNSHIRYSYGIALAVKPQEHSYERVGMFIGDLDGSSTAVIEEIVRVL